MLQRKSFREKNPSVTGRLKTRGFAVYVLLELSGLSGRTAAAGLKRRF